MYAYLKRQVLVKPVLIYDSKCKGSKAYLGLAKEFLKQEKKAVNRIIFNGKKKEKIRKRTLSTFK